jgi:hypothetical protein
MLGGEGRVTHRSLGRTSLSRLVEMDDVDSNNR